MINLTKILNSLRVIYSSQLFSAAIQVKLIYREHFYSHLGRTPGQLSESKITMIHMAIGTEISTLYTHLPSLI